jgi:hypothetical protein
MGACVRLPGPPGQLAIQIPGGAKLVSMPSSTQSIPNDCDPVDSLMKIAMPAFGTIQPIFDIIGFIMAFADLFICLMQVLGAISLVTGNPAISIMFPLANIKNTADNEPIPGFLAGEDTGVPDVNCLLDKALGLLCKAMKLIGLIPQVSMFVTLKDSLNSLLTVLACVQSKINSLTDKLQLVPADTGDPLIDTELACAREAIQDAVTHAAGPLGSIIPLMTLVGKLAEPLKHGLPAPVANLIKTAVNLGLIPFPDDTAKTNFLNFVDQLAAGAVFEIPDFSNISDIAATMDDVRNKLGPILPFIDLMQQLVQKLQNC